MKTQLANKRAQFRNYQIKRNQVSSSDDKKDLLNIIWCGDCRDILHDKYPDNFFDLIVTSPPYAEARKKVYGGISPDRFASWMLERTMEFLRVLKPSGTFILNIKEKVVNGERHTYVIDLIKGMRNQGWIWTEEFIWHKKNCYPGKWPNRFRDAWERLLQFNKTKHFKMRQEAVMVPIGGWAKTRLRNLSETDKRRDESRARSGFAKKVANWIGRELVYPTNVLYGATECSFRNHSAVFPYWLPEWFIKLFTDPGDVVLDPFLGSGTTAVAAKNLERWYVGIDINEDYCLEAQRALLENQKKENKEDGEPSKNSRLHKSEHRQLSFEENREPQELKS